MGPDTLAILIPLSAIILGISAGVVGIVTKHRQLVQRADLRHKERLVAIEKGLELPPEPEDPIQRPRYLLKGLVWSFAGIAAYLALNALAGSDESTLAAIPVAIGAAYLIYYFVQGRREDAAALEKMKQQ